MNGRVRMNIRLLTLEERSLGVPAERGEGAREEARGLRAAGGVELAHPRGDGPTEANGLFICEISK